MYSVRDALAADFEGTLKLVSEMGYDGVEFAGIYGRTAEEVKALCEKYNLIPISAHVSIQEMLTIPDVFKTFHDIGCKYITVPYLPKEYRVGGEKFDSLIPMVKEIALKAKENGMKLLYHNHDFEFVKLEDGSYFLDTLYAEVSADLLETEIDTCWVNVAGENPAEYLKKYAGRAHVVHLKDFYKKVDNVDGMYELIGIKPASAAAAAEAFGFRPLGNGLQNIPEIIDAAKVAGAEWLIVEQDRPTPETIPTDEVRISREYLKKLGY